MTGVKCFAAAVATMRPTFPPPVYIMCAHGKSKSRVVSGIAPLTTVTISGSRYFAMSEARSVDDAGVNSEGLSTTAHPAATAPIW